MRLSALTILIAAVGLWAGCYDPDMGPSPFQCSQTFQVECPDGYERHMHDYGKGEICICVPEGQPPPDLGRPDRKILSDTELLPAKDGADNVFIDGGIEIPGGNCSDSDVEPNNWKGKATPLTGKTGLVPGWEICYKFDIDQYSYTVKAGDSLTVKVKFSHSKGDLDAAMVGPDGKIKVYSRGTGDTETLTIPSADAGTYIIGVWGARQDAPKSSPAVNTYDLDISLN